MTNLGVICAALVLAGGLAAGTYYATGGCSEGEWECCPQPEATIEADATDPTISTTVLGNASAPAASETYHCDWTAKQEQCASVAIECEPKACEPKDCATAVADETAN